MSNKKSKIITDSSMSDMFNEMISGDGSPGVVHEKLKKFNVLIKELSDNLSNFCTGPFPRKFPEYKEHLGQITKWQQACDALLSEASADIKLTAKEIEGIEDRKDLVMDRMAIKKWKMLKDHNQTKSIVIACSDMAMYRSHIAEKDGKISDAWILKHPGLSYQPFKFTKLDVKHIWTNSATTNKVKHYCLVFIRAVFSKCDAVYDLVTSPDLDCNKFSQGLIESIERLKKIPELSRCTQAFDKIKGSADLLKKNFASYHKDVIESKNPNVVAENFIIDVSQSGDMPSATLRQIRIIMKHFRKQTQNGVAGDSRVRKLFNNLSDNMTAAIDAKTQKPQVQAVEDDSETPTQKESSPKTKTVKSTNSNKDVKKKKDD